MLLPKANALWIDRGLAMRRFLFSLAVLLIMVCLCSCGEKKEEAPARVGSPTELVSSKRNVIYAYSLSDVTYPEQFTAIVISFLDTFPDGRVKESSFPHLKETLDTFHENHPYTKVIAGLGGASNSETLGRIIMDPEKRTVLAQTTAALVKSRGIDGIDLDWEYYSDYAECNAAYLDFAIQLRALLGKDCIISMAGQSAGSFYDEASCIKLMNEVLDYVCVMTYDFDYSGRQRSYIGYNGNFTQLRGVMNGYASVVTDKSKLIVGLPLYGLKYAVEEDRVYYRGENAVRYMDDLGYSTLSSSKELGTKAANPDAYDDDNGVALAFRRKFMYTFDNETTVTTKTEWACENGFGGMMAWVASSDDAMFTLERAVTTVLNKY